MTVKDLKDSLKLEVLCESKKGLEKDVSAGIACDLNSYVMAHAPENAAWLTVLGDINSVAVCIFSNISVLILTGNTQLEQDAKQKAIEYSVTILRSYKSSFQLSCEINELLKGEI